MRTLELNANARSTGCAQSDGRISAVSIGGQGAIQYSLDNGNFQLSNEFTNLTAGTYQVVARDTAGQTDTTMIQVGASAPPVAVATASTQQVYLNQGGQANFYSTNSSGAQQYQWTFPDGSTANTATASFTFSGNSAILPVILTVTKDGCSDSDTLLIEVTNNISVRTLEEALTFEASPNPVQDRVLVTWDLPHTQTCTLVIHNALGQRVYWQTFEGQQQTNIHLGNQPAGLYTITLLAEDVALSRPLIKQ